MILPDKYLSVPESLLGQAAVLLTQKRKLRTTVSDEWRRFSNVFPDSPFDRFLEALTLLFLLGVVDFRSGLLDWSTK